MILGLKYRAAIDGTAEMSIDDATSPTPLSAIVEAFEKLAKILDSQEEEGDLHLDTFCQACSLVSILFSCLGLAFKFAEMEYVSKVDNLLQASKTYDTLVHILDFDVANDTVKSPGSRSRNLRRVRQGLDLIRAIFENFLATDDNSLREAASTAYAQVCAPYHTWAVRTAVAAGMYALPSRDQLLKSLKETHESAEIKMKQYIRASLPVIQYIDKLYLSRDIVLDW
ncbi:putative glycolipid transfer protein [Rosa chinensis]|uniref:Putative glycolipid transfer protein n=1 Tax=Rosa chinensis TaxID=74649 RepID=A0A2P6R1T9_ROSCH|nr:ACD11 homolog protein [Rosa chinensis]PRQ40386.1 putative glycolipid transfer protein [Rosa chinensis]